MIVEKDSLSVVIGVKDSRAMLYSLTSKQTVELSAYCDPWGVSAMCYWERRPWTGPRTPGSHLLAGLGTPLCLCLDFCPETLIQTGDEWMRVIHMLHLVKVKNDFKQQKKWAQKRLDTTFFFFNPLFWGLNAAGMSSNQIFPSCFTYWEDAFVSLTSSLCSPQGKM